MDKCHKSSKNKKPIWSDRFVLLNILRRKAQLNPCWTAGIFSSLWYLVYAFLDEQFCPNASVFFTILFKVYLLVIPDVWDQCARDRGFMCLGGDGDAAGGVCACLLCQPCALPSLMVKCPGANRCLALLLAREKGSNSCSSKIISEKCHFVGTKHICCCWVMLISELKCRI